MAGAAPSPLDAALDAVTAHVASQKTVLDSAVAYVKSVPGLIATAVTQAQAAGATPAELQRLTDLGTAIDANGAEVQAAITANTPTPAATSAAPAAPITPSGATATTAPSGGAAPASGGPAPSSATP